MNRPRRIGIIGGMGPQATVLLMQKLIDAVPATDDGDHIPLIVDSNTQVPSRIAWLIEGTGEDPGPELVRMARGLERAGATALAMPCNTAHHYAREIQQSVGIPFLDMVKASAERARQVAGAGSTVGVLASPAVRETGIFDRALSSLGLGVAYPEDQAALLSAIRSVKQHGNGPDARRTLTLASAALLERGVRTQLIACTEFSIIADAAAEGATTMDTLDVLVREIVNFAFGKTGGLQEHRMTG